MTYMLTKNSRQMMVMNNALPLEQCDFGESMVDGARRRDAGSCHRRKVCGDDYSCYGKQEKQLRGCGFAKFDKDSSDLCKLRKRSGLSCPPGK